MEKINGTKFDAIAGSELRDTQGEILDVKGADISELEAGRGRINDNHSNKLPDVIGRITKAKKIFGPQDCEDDRQKHYWDKVKAPYIYVTGVLFDNDGDHRSARAAAAILKHQHTTDSPLKLKCSVEGGIVKRGEKDSRILSRTKINGLAFTFTPANNATLVEGLDLQKSAITQEEKELISSYVPFAKNDVPTLIEISNNISIERVTHKINKINELIKTVFDNSNGSCYDANSADDLVSCDMSLDKSEAPKSEDCFNFDTDELESFEKALTAGYGGAGAPTDLTGGGVFQTEKIENNKSFRYITCPSCSLEQPYLKYQVKCRKCNKSFNFDTLAKFFLTKNISK